MSAEPLFVSNEFDIFARKPVETWILETTATAYKPIALVDQSDLKFPIPADSETYIDPNIKLYIRGKLTKANGTILDDKDFAAVKNNFLHSLFSKRCISPNGVQLRRSLNYIIIVLISRHLLPMALMHLLRISKRVLLSRQW